MAEEQTEKKARPVIKIGRPENDGSDPAAIFEQTPLFLRLKPYIGETGEMQHRPEAIGSIREIVARDGGARTGLRPQKITSRPLARISTS